MSAPSAVVADGVSDGVSDTWRKVHREFLETLIHRVLLTVEAGAGRDAQVAEHVERMRSLATELVDLGAPAPLDQLEAIAGLSPIERELVALLVAYELDPAIGSGLTDRFGSGVPTPAIAAALFDLSVSDTAALVEPGAPLRRLALVVDPPVAPPAVERPIRLADRTLHYLCGSGAIDQRLRGLLEPIDPVPLTDHLTDVAHNVRDWLASDFGGRARIAFVGPAGSGRAAVAAHVSADFGMVLYAIDLVRLVGRADRLDLARAITRELLLTPAAMYVDLDHATDDDPARAAAIDEAVDSIDGLVVIGTARHHPGRVAMSIDVPLLERADRVVLWRRSLDPLAEPDTDVDVDVFADQFRFGPRRVARVVDAAAAGAELARRPLDDRLVRAVSTAEAGAGMAALARRIDADVGWDRLVVGDDERTLLRALCDQIRHRGRVYDEWGVARGSSRGLGTSALFTGPPGTGKTLAAEVIATELALPLYRIDLSSVVSKYIGETEKNLARVFDAAEQGGAILFFDEADALFGKRTEVKDSHDRYANIEIDYLLQRMEDHAGLSILATNRKSDIDPAFLRRLRFVVAFPFPREGARREIWATELAVGIPTRAVDLDALARLELAGGNIRNVVVNGAFAAAADGTDVTMAHLVQAAAQEYAKIDKLPSRAEFGVHYDEVAR